MYMQLTLQEFMSIWLYLGLYSTQLFHWLILLQLNSIWWFLQLFVQIFLIWLLLWLTLQIHWIWMILQIFSIWILKLFLHLLQQLWTYLHCIDVPGTERNWTSQLSHMELLTAQYMEFGHKLFAWFCYWSWFNFESGIETTDTHANW